MSVVWVSIRTWRNNDDYSENEASFVHHNSTDLYISLVPGSDHVSSISIYVFISCPDHI